MKPRYRDDNLLWISDAYEQESGDDNWIKINPLLETKLKKIPIISGSSTNTIKTFSSVDINVNDKILVRTGTSPDVWTQISIEGISVESGEFSLSNFTVLPERSNNTGTSALHIAAAYNSTIATTNSARGGKFSPDGLNLYTSIYSSNLQQYTLSTPFDVETASNSGNVLGLPTAQANGFFFANNGRYLFVSSGATTGGYTLRRHELSIPWNISSAIDYVDMINPVNGDVVLYRMMDGVFSEDGTKWMMTDAAAATGISWGTTLTPFGFDGTKAQGQWTETHASFSASTIFDVESMKFTADGKHLIHYYDDSGVASTDKLQICKLATPFEIGTTAVFSDILLDNLPSSPYTDGYIISSVSNNDESSIWVSDDMRYIVIQSKVSADDILTLETTVGDRLNLDISTQGLTETPTDGYVYLLPETEISLATGADSNSTWAMTERVATTALGVSSSTIVSSKDNLIEVGDKLLLNGTDEVTVTAVTETPAGQPKIEMASVGGMKIIQEKTLRPTWIANNLAYSGYTKFQISGNGEKLFLAAGSPSSSTSSEIGIYVYDMTTPWDISTLVPNPYRHKYSTSDLGYHNNSSTLKYFETYLGPANGPVGLQFSADGKTLTYARFADSTGDILIVTVHLSIPWDLESVVSKDYTRNGQHFSGSGTNYTKDMVFNGDGTQVWFTSHPSGGTTIYHDRYDLSTPYVVSSGISSASQISSTRTTSNPTTQAGLIKRISPDNTQVISLGSGFYPTTLTNNQAGGDHVYFYKNSLTTPGDFGSIQNGTPMDLPNEADIGYIVCDHQFSPDGTRWYFINSNGNLYEYEVKQKTLNSYVVTYETQSTAPDTIYLKDKSVPVNFDVMTVATPDPNQLTTSVSWGVSAPIIADTRAIQVKIKGGSPDFEFDTIRIDLDKSS